MTAKIAKQAVAPVASAKKAVKKAAKKAKPASETHLLNQLLAALATRLAGIEDHVGDLDSAFNREATTWDDCREDVKRLADKLDHIGDRLVEFNARLANLEIRGGPQDHDVLPALKKIGYLLGNLDSRLGALELTAPCKCPVAASSAQPPASPWPPNWLVRQAQQPACGGPK